MENEQVQQPASVVTPEADFSLDDYRAQRETPAKEAVKETAPAKDLAADAGADEVLEKDATPEQLEAKQKKQGGFQKTISKQAAEIAELKRQLATGAPAPAAAKPAQAAVPAAAVPPLDYEKVKAKPTLADCVDLAEFTEKLADWTNDRRDWLKAGQEAAAKQKAETTTLTDNWKARTAEFKASNADYDDVMAGVSDVLLSPAHQRIFLESENGVELAYTLAQDPEELKRIAALDPLKAAVAIGRLSASLAKAGAQDEEEAAAPEPEIKVSAAPKPFRPVNGAATRIAPNVASLSPEDYRKARESGRIH